MTFPYMPLRKYPQPRAGIEFATYWHRFTGIEDFYICSKCYQEHLRNTLLEGFYDVFYHDILPGHAANCDFNNMPQAKRVLQSVLKSGDPEELLSFAHKRAITGKCNGLGGVRGGSGVQWYGHAELPTFVVCESCYLEYFPTSPSSPPYLHPHAQEQQDDSIWTCDLAVPYIKYLAGRLATDGNWMAFRDATKYRMSLPSCTPQAVKRGSRKWYRSTIPWPIQETMVCEACVLDYAHEPDILRNFAETTIEPAAQILDWICEMQVQSLEFCTKELLEKDYTRWHLTVADIVRNPLCSQGDITHGEWYRLVDVSGAEIVTTDICAACYSGYFAATGYTYVLTRKTFPPGSLRICDFSSKSPRSSTYLAKFTQLLFTGDNTPLITYASRVSQLPCCPRGQSVQNQFWWGHDDFFFCTSCYHEFGQDTSLAPSFPVHNQVFESATCDMYTPNMRRRYILACRAQSLADFEAYCKHRAEVKAAYDNAVARNQEMERARQAYRAHAGLSTTTAFAFGSMSAGMSGHLYQPMIDPGFTGALQNQIATTGNAKSGSSTGQAIEMELRRRWEEME